VIHIEKSNKLLR